MSTNEKDINYVIDIKKENDQVSTVTVKFKNGQIYELPKNKAKELADMGQLYGYIFNEFVPCLCFKNEYLFEYYLKDNVLYRADSAVIYNECNDRLGGECSLFTVKNYYIICYHNKHFVVKSNVLTEGFAINDARSFKVKDGRLYIVVQGLATFNYGTVQAAYNDLMYVTEDGIYCLYHSNKKRMEEIVKYYKPVDMNSTKLADIRQKIVNASIETELNKFDVTCRENVICIGNLMIDLGGNTV